MALPCDCEGQCMVCKEKPSPSETLSCGTCATPWHLSCLPQPPLSLSDTHWDCPDCTQTPVAPASLAPPPFSNQLLSAIRHIQADTSLTDQQKANMRQQLLSGGVSADQPSPSNPTDLLLDGTFNCSICVHLPDRPVTTPCGHNFCLKCFQKMVAQGNRSCANCRSPIPRKMASQPRINSQLAMAIRLAKTAQSDGPSAPPKVQHFVRNQDRPATAFTTERAKKTGKANACSGKIFVTVAQDHFGPILAENDPDRNRGVLVGDTWEDRMECRQWGAHLPHVSGIAGQSHYGAQSVALSGGYVDDEDHGEWFLYTGSGGRDLSGNKRTNKNQSFDQKFELHNEALRVSCRKGYPVRVVRSHKEKRSSYAPESGVRYDGIYRVEKCWRKIGVQGWKVCRYLFVRCDNEPAPWTSDESGDRPRPLPQVDELKDAVDLTERKCDPWWDYDGEKGCWLWKKPPPETQMKAELKDGTTVRGKRKAKDVSVKQRLLKEFGCQICRKVLSFPLTTPCGHNFCKACLEGAFSGQSFVRNRECKGGRTLRAQKTVMKCPSCSNDIADFLQNPQVNREMMSIIESLQSEAYGQSDDSSDKNNENLQGEVDDSKSTDSSEEVLEEINDGEESSDENLHDDATEVSKIVDSSEKVLEEIKDSDLNQPHKRKKD